MIVYHHLISLFLLFLCLTSATQVSLFLFSHLSFNNFMVEDVNTADHVTCLFINMNRSLRKWKRVMIQKRDSTGSEISSCTTQKLSGVMTHATPLRGGGQPQSRRHSPTARSSQRHVPVATTARALQERKAEAKVNRQELDKGKKQGSIK